jgi:hypothetical protein
LDISIFIDYATRHTSSSDPNKRSARWSDVA